jgi:uncharacterized protein YcfJ
MEMQTLIVGIVCLSFGACLGVAVAGILAGGRIQEIVERGRVISRYQQLLESRGHSYHCASRMVWGDGECECGLLTERGY